MNGPAHARSGELAPRALAAAGVGLAALVSLLRKGFQFDGYYADDQFWNALLVERLHPGLLADDPVVALIGDRYQSALFELLARIAPITGLPAASLACFCGARVLTCAAIYRLAVALTGSRGAGVASAFLLAGSSVSYLGGINFVETILTPRGFALPFGLLAMDAFFRSRPAAMTAWLLVCLAVHPISGASFLGTLALCGIAFGDAAARRSTLAALGVLAPAVVFVAFWTGAFGAASGALRFDPTWASIVRDTVGPWVYLAQTPGAVWLKCLWLPALAALALPRLDAPVLRRAALQLGLAALCAVALHAVLVDGAQLRFALQVAPQRATVALVAVAIVAVGLLLRNALVSADPLRRIPALAFLLAALLLGDPSLALLLGVLLLALELAPRGGGRALRGALAVALVAAVLALVGAGAAASFRLAPADVARRLARLRVLGVNEPWAAVQEQLRARSAVGDVVMAPPPESPRVFAQRPSALRVKMQSFTHVSRDFALRYRAWYDAVGRHLEDANTVRAIALARQSGARWLVVDDRLTPEAVGDPAPDLRVAPYRAYSLGNRDATRHGAPSASASAPKASRVH